MISTDPKYAIGIDLGTTYCSVAVFENGRVKVIEDGQGNRRIPSYVAFTDDEYLVGFLAKSQAAVNPTNTVHGIKRILGRKFDDSQLKMLEKDFKYWPFTVIEEKGKPKIQVQYKNETKTFCPEQITALLLTELKEMAEPYTGNSGVLDVVISVPANFNDLQRKATMDAASIAGLNVLKLINEPTAAAAAYCTEKKITGTRNLMIFNLGGGSFDVSMVTIQDGDLEVKAVSGETHLGGEDFVNNMLKNVANHFKQNENIDIKNKKFLARLKDACEVAKKELSKLPETRINVDGCDHPIKMNAEKFNEYNEALYTKMMKHAKKVRKDSVIDNDNFMILLVGGCTRIPKIEELLKTEFCGVRISKGINRDEAVAHGAAVQAALLHGVMSGVIQSIVEHPDHSKIPHNEDLSAKATLQIKDGIDCSIGEMLHNIPENIPETYLVPINESTPRPEEDVSARRPSTDNEVLQSTQSSDEENIEKIGLSKENIKEMRNIALDLQNDCKIYKDRMRCRNDLEGHIIKVQAEFRKMAINSEIMVINREIMVTCDEILDWMSSNEKATKEEYESKHKELETLRKKTIKALRATSSLPAKTSPRSTIPTTGNQSTQSSASTHNYSNVQPQIRQEEPSRKGNHSSPKTWFSKNKKPKSSKTHNAKRNASSSRYTKSGEENITRPKDHEHDHSSTKSNDKGGVIARITNMTHNMCTIS